MLVRFNKNRCVEWTNHYITAEKAKSRINDYTIWLESEYLPTPDDRNGYQAYLVLSLDNELFYEYEPVPVENNYSDVQTLMQAIADLELIILEGGNENV